MVIADARPTRISALSVAFLIFCITARTPTNAARGTAIAVSAATPYNAFLAFFPIGSRILRTMLIATIREEREIAASRHLLVSEYCANKNNIPPSRVTTPARIMRVGTEPLTPSAADTKIVKASINADSAPVAAANFSIGIKLRATTATDMTPIATAIIMMFLLQSCAPLVAAIMAAITRPSAATAPTPFRICWTFNIPSSVEITPKIPIAAAVRRSMTPALRISFSLANLVAHMRPVIIAPRPTRAMPAFTISLGFIPARILAAMLSTSIAAATLRIVPPTLSTSFPANLVAAISPTIKPLSATRPTAALPISFQSMEAIIFAATTRTAIATAIPSSIVPVL